MPPTDAPRSVRPVADRPAVNKPLALSVLAIAQLMVVLDATIVNVALPDISRALKVSGNADLQWVVTGYTLTFGGFLLLGGKLADRVGRKKVFIAGAGLFALASLVGGLASSLGVLLVSRGAQGIGGALMSPAALSLITVIFAEGKERNRALGIYAAITAGGAAIGLILGGVLTEYASWRWVFFVNLPIAAVAVLGAVMAVPDSRDEQARGFDVPGAVLVTSGLMALVYGLVKGNDNGWGSGRTIGVLALAAVLLAAFVVVQTRVREPLVPFRVFRSRSVLGADVGALLIGAGIFAIFFFLILWMQQVNGYSPVKSGLAFLPMTVLLAMSAGVGSQLLGRLGPRPLLIVGPATAGAGLLLLGLRLEVHSSYLTVVLPSLAMVAIGMGMAFVALTSAAVAGVPQEDAGIASALLNAGQQVGGALGLAILTAVSTARTDALAPGGPPRDPAGLAQYLPSLVDGWSLGFVVGGCLLFTAAAVTGSLIRVSPEDAQRAIREAPAAAA